MGEIPASVTVTYGRQYRRCGKAGCTVCSAGGQGHGPYWYAYWKADGKRRSRYLGRAAPAGAAVADGQPLPQAALTMSPSAELPLRVQTLGGFAVWRGGRRAPDATWGKRRGGRLLKCLLGSPGWRLHREQAIEVLWPDLDPPAGRRALSAALHPLLSALAPEDGEGGTADAVSWIDADAFARAASGALAGHDLDACRAALALYTGEYLPDDRGERWADGPRRRLAGLHHRLLLRASDHSAARGESVVAEEYLLALLAADPAHEEAAARLMALLAGQGRRSEALRTYDALAAALAEDLDVVPGAGVEALRARLVAEDATTPPAARPPVVSPPDRPTNLPAALTGFVGRAWEQGEVARLLLGTPEAPCRLLTLTGVGGVGKSRLALEVGSRLMDTYPDGVWLVELASTAAVVGEDVTPVARVVAAGLGVREEAGRPVPDTLAVFLHPRRVLLLLDNCEHLAGASAALAATLLRRCAGLTILATSRVVLGAPGEIVWAVPPLAVPPDGTRDFAELARSEAVRLFSARARSARSGFVLGAHNAADVARICRRLGGIPLALELAAARLGAMGIEEVAAQLDDSFRLLTGGGAALPPRQRTLRLSLLWSDSLLGEPERAVLRHLAVFAGGWSLVAADAVCAGDGPGDNAVAERLAQLVRHSLVLLDGERSPARYRLLEPVRQYAADRLAEEGEEGATRDRHLAWCVDLAEEARPELTGARQAEWLVRLETEHDNLRAALAWGVRGGGDRAAGLQLAGALWRFWYQHGHFGEGRGWLDDALSGGPGAATDLRVRALSGAGNLAGRQGDYGRAIALYEECLAIRRATGDTPGIAASLTNLGVAAHQQGEYGRAVAYHEEALALLRPLGDAHGIATVIDNLGNAVAGTGDHARALILHGEGLTLRRAVGDAVGIASSLHNVAETLSQLGDHGRARALYEEALAMQRDLGDTYGIAYALVNLGEVARHQGDRGRALAGYEEGLALLRELGDQRGIAAALSGLGDMASLDGDTGRATALYREALELGRDSGAADLLAEGLEHLCWVAAARGQWPRAARLGGAGEAARARCGMPTSPDLGAMRAALDADGLALWQEGQGMQLAEAVALALDPGTARA